MTSFIEGPHREMLSALADIKEIGGFAGVGVMAGYKRLWAEARDGSFLTCTIDDREWQPITADELRELQADAVRLARADGHGA